MGIEDLGLRPEEVGLSGSPTWVAALRPVEIERERLVLAGDPESAAESLLLALRDRGLPGLGERTGARSLPPLPPVVHDPNPSRQVWSVAECAAATMVRPPRRGPRASAMYRWSSRARPHGWPGRWAARPRQCCWATGLSRWPSRWPRPEPPRCCWPMPPSWGSTPRRHMPGCWPAPSGRGSPGRCCCPRPPSAATWLRG